MAIPVISACGHPKNQLPPRRSAPFTLEVMDWTTIDATLVTVAVCIVAKILLRVTWRLVETMRHAFGKSASHIVVVLVVEHVAYV